jgi:amidophosphoribosyltransferase
MDTGDRATLLAAGRTIDEVAEYLVVDTLAYLDLDALIAATEVPESSFCTACLSGNYPTGVPLTDSKFVLERSP